MSEFDEIYRTTGSFFGEEPEPLLERFAERIEVPGPVLDLGAGQGRNALFLARKGFRVDGIDPSDEAVSQLSRVAEDEDLPLRAVKAGFETFDPAGIAYGAILAFGLLQVLTRDSIALLDRKIKGWLRPGGLLFVTAFTVDDPAFVRLSAAGRRAGRTSVESDQGETRTFLEPGELEHLFSGLKRIHFWEGMGPDHRHGDGPLQHHALTEAVFALHEE